MPKFSANHPVSAFELCVDRSVCAVDSQTVIFPFDIPVHIDILKNLNNETKIALVVKLDFDVPMVGRS